VVNSSLRSRSLPWEGPQCPWERMLGGHRAGLAEINFQITYKIYVIFVCRWRYRDGRVVCPRSMVESPTEYMASADRRRSQTSTLDYWVYRGRLQRCITNSCVCKIEYVEGKVVLITSAPCHEDVWESGGITPSSLTSALDGGEWAASRSDRFTPGKDPRHSLDDRLCGLVASVPGYRSRGPEFDSRRYQIF
jgi:hypothetical protein